MTQLKTTFAGEGIHGVSAFVHEVKLGADPNGTIALRVNLLYMEGGRQT